MSKYYDDTTKTKNISFSGVEMSLIKKIIRHTSFSLPVLHRLFNITARFKDMYKLCELNFMLDLTRKDLINIIEFLEHPNDECKDNIPELLEDAKKLAIELRQNLDNNEFWFITTTLSSDTLCRFFYYF